ncbi:hypothetical protein AXG93_1069s1080 [Marchantia polymorpha subsp. ruderalis]|uniref:Uncharacterized protein n=1 Tax=Marchantia polymorpha subsp. ruderalis TaxID=1480154 RepID=A0A176WDH6_MARPO|nr:hypothetical protein AXG93_1069s1080 [Marchantia polymorpha subsp. ruderalis]
MLPLLSCKWTFCTIPNMDERKPPPSESDIRSNSNAWSKKNKDQQPCSITPPSNKDQRVQRANNEPKARRMPLAGPMYACMAWGRVLDMHIRAWHPSPGCRKRAFTAAVELVTDKAFWPRRYPAKAEFRRASPARGQADDRRVGDSFSAVGKSSGGPGRSGAEFLHQEVKAPGRGSWRRMAGNRADAAATVPRRDGDMARPQARTACPSCCRVLQATLPVVERKFQALGDRVGI